MTTKIHLLCDALGCPLRLLLTPGQAAGIKSAAALLAGIRAKGVIADRAHDANPLRTLPAAAGRWLRMNRSFAACAMRSTASPTICARR